MADRPILFNDAMVRAILSGAKTQTRRPVKLDSEAMAYVRSIRPPIVRDERVLGWCPFGVPGDLLWVRECFSLHRIHDCTAPNKVKPSLLLGVAYRATGDVRDGIWRPSIHMPRWASRLTLRVTDVRVERVQDISAADATAEGARRFEGLAPSFTGSTEAKWSMFSPKTHGECLGSARMAFANGWNCAYACGPSSWEANPWVWVVSFERAEVPRG